IIVILIAVALILYKRKSYHTLGGTTDEENVEDLDEIGGSSEEDGKSEEMFSEITEQDIREENRNNLFKRTEDLKAALKEEQEGSNEIGTEIEEAENKVEVAAVSENNKPEEKNPVREEEKEVLINMEDDEPFEIEFFDLDDNNKN
ncbi:MAG: hypothetical protein K2N34_08985, partial [Lachnospiraceae bacterium]|nr:hypothetical protein [Lachnospiraceae bacterium]